MSKKPAGGGTRATFPKDTKKPAAGELKKIKVSISIYLGDRTFSLRQEIDTMMGWEGLEAWTEDKIKELQAQQDLPLSE